MISVKDLANELGVTTQAIYKYFRNYPELSEHKDKGFLDDHAADFIRSKSNPNPVVIINQENLDRIEEYRLKYEHQMQLNLELSQQLLNLQSIAEQRLIEASKVDYLKEEKEMLENNLNDQLELIADLKEQLDETNSILKEKEETIEKLKSRSLLDRIFNK